MTAEITSRGVIVAPSKPSQPVRSCGYCVPIDGRHEPKCPQR